MPPVSIRRLLTLFGLGSLSVLISFRYGGDGVEAFFSLYFLTGIMLAFYVSELVRQLFLSKAWLITKLFGVIVAGFVLFTLLGLTLIPFIDDTYLTGGAQRPDINWVVLGFILISYLLNRFILHRENDLPLYQLTLNSFSAILSMAVMLFGFMRFIVSDGILESLFLVLAIELQFITNYVYTQTSYVKTAYTKITQNKYYKVLSEELKFFTLVAALGLPTLIAFAIILYMP